MNYTATKDEYYDDAYFNRFEKQNPVQRTLIRFVDRKEPVLSFLKSRVPRGAKLLDVGCGNGRFLQHVQDYYECTGMDFSRSAIQAARQKVPRATFLQASADDVENVDGMYEIITCFDLIEHLNDFKPLLRGVVQKLKPNGYFVLSAPNADSLGKRLKKQEWYGYRDKSHVWFKSADEWSKALERFGLRTQRVFVNGLMDPPYVTWIPSMLQTVCIKYLTQGVSLLGVPLPHAWGEVCFLVSRRTSV